MKRILIIILAIVCGVTFSNSYAKKPRKQCEQEAVKQQEVGQPLLLPCEEEAQGDEEYYAALGFGKARDQMHAMQEAMHSAKIKLRQQLGDGEYTLDGIEKVCQKIHMDSNGYFVAYIAIRIPRRNITDKAGSPSE